MDSDLAGEDVDEAKRSGGGVGEVVDRPRGVGEELIGELAEQQALATPWFGDEDRDRFELEGVEEAPIGLVKSLVMEA